MAKANITFLGTGSAGGIKAQGKSGRLESSLLIETVLVNVLIDVTRDFKRQTKLLPKTLDTLLITHAHLDAIGGLKDFIHWQGKKGGLVPILSLSETIKKIRNKHKNNLDLLDLHQIKPFNKFQLGDLVITPFSVSHSIQKGFPTLGFHFSLADKKLVYVSDVANWNKKAAQLLKSADVLIIDGAMWGKKIISHLDIKKVLPKLCLWPIKKIIFTQIGHTAPRHEVLKEEVKKICSKAQPAYDGMAIKL